MQKHKLKIMALIGALFLPGMTLAVSPSYQVAADKCRKVAQHYTDANCQNNATYYNSLADYYQFLANGGHGRVKPDGTPDNCGQQQDLAVKGSDIFGAIANAAGVDPNVQNAANIAQNISTIVEMVQDTQAAEKDADEAAADDAQDQADQVNEDTVAQKDDEFSKLVGDIGVASEEDSAPAADNSAPQASVAPCYKTYECHVKPEADADLKTTAGVEAYLEVQNGVVQALYIKNLSVDHSVWVSGDAGSNDSANGHTGEEIPSGAQGEGEIQAQDFGVKIVGDTQKNQDVIQNGLDVNFQYYDKNCPSQ